MCSVASCLQVSRPYMVHVWCEGENVYVDSCPQGGGGGGLPGVRFRSSHMIITDEKYVID